MPSNNIIELPKRNFQKGCETCQKLHDAIGYGAVYRRPGDRMIEGNFHAPIEGLQKDLTRHLKTHERKEKGIVRGARKTQAEKKKLKAQGRLKLKKTKRV